MSTDNGYLRYGGEYSLFLGLSVFIHVSEKHADYLRGLAALFLRILPPMTDRN